MSEPAPLQVEEALDELVNQFSDQLSFLRELVQNALDAGSDEVEISVIYEPDEKGETGVAVIHVDDFGEGMTREIIEKRLTRLFSSAKDGDKTKIGKFGIGFVSVFAIDPEAVCVDTSREGEHWRVLFDANRRFKLMRREDPVDGTKIRIYKKLPAAEFEGFAARARDVVRYWCKHTRGEIRFDGELVSEPLGLDAPCQVVHDDGFSKVVVGHPPAHQPFFGFYNTGLTLIEGRDEYFDAVAFKASSPHLEHTLTRDAVIRDEGYHRVVGAVQTTVGGALCERVFEMLEAEATSEAAELRDYLYAAAAWHAGRAGAELHKAVRQRAVFVSPAGNELSVERCLDDHRHDEILFSAFDSPLTRALEESGRTVVRGAVQTPTAALMRMLAPAQVQLRTAEEAYCRPLPPRGDLDARRLAKLANATHHLLVEFGAKLSRTMLAHFGYEGSSIASEVAITQEEFGEVTPLTAVGSFGTGFFSARRILVINADHRAVHELVELAAGEPDFAAYLLAKLFFLGEQLDAENDGRLARIAAQKRWE